MAAITIPILPSADFDVTAEFWSGFGFAEIRRWPGDYLVLRHEGHSVELHFRQDEDVDRSTNDVACYVRFGTPDEARTAHAAWADVVVPAPAVLSEPRAEPWGAVEFHVIDPHGNLVRVGGFPPRD
ncbi:VOC family protein [Antribacter gilvus]|uniref:VOC family protein n=1 Tax=Antribacter gilvus TaxID=2304675 RepID=UPI000F77B462|nr:VOC family protein [Antribacter gilvus]